MTIFDDIDTTSFGLGVKHVDKDNITKFLPDITNKAWVSHYAIITKHQIRNWVERE